MSKFDICKENWKKMLVGSPELLKDGDETVLVISGIIDERCEDVYKSIKENNFKITEEIHENGWCAISLRLQ